jgi:hypothetical protein
MLGSPQYCRYKYNEHFKRYKRVPITTLKQIQPVLGDGPFTRHRLNKNAKAMLAWEPGCTPDEEQ